MDRFFRFSSIGRNPFSLSDRSIRGSFINTELDKKPNDDIDDSGTSEDEQENVDHQNESSSGYTRILTQNKSYDWIVENIRSFRAMIPDVENTRESKHNREEFIDIRSPSFSVPVPGVKPSTKWHLYLRFGGCKVNEVTTHASIWLVLEDQPVPIIKSGSLLDLNCIKVTFEAKILDENSHVKKTHRSGFRTFNINKPKSHPWGFEKFISYAEFDNLNSTIFSGNKLRIQLELRLFLGTANFPLPQKRIHIQELKHKMVTNAANSGVGSGDSQQSTVQSNSNSNMMQNNANDMRSAISTLWKNDEFTDVKLVVGDKKFPAHKAILAARSTVFATMLGRGSFTENKSDEVTIEVFSPEVVEALLEFIYTDHTDLLTNMEKALELLEAAEMYALPSLKYDCYVELISKMNLETAAKIAVIAFYFKPSADIMAFIKEFFESNLSDIKLTDGYKEEYYKHHAAFAKILRGEM